jgi:hypothetical protein
LNTASISASGYRPHPASAATVGAAGSSDRQTRWVVRLMSVDLLLAVLLQKIAIPIGGGSQIQLPLLIHLVLLALLPALAGAVLHRRRLIIFLVLVVIATGSHVYYQRSDYSAPSLLLLIAIYVSFVLVVRIDRAEYFRILRHHQTLALGVAALVASNWLGQIVGLGMVDLEAVIPESFIFRTYVYIQPIHWGSPWMKPNAVFFLETSHTSQFLARAVLIELCLLQRPRHLLALGLGLVSTFGGTGFLAVVLSAPVALFYLRPRMILALLVGLPIMIGAAGALGVLDNVTSRSTEYQVRGSSADNRFVAPVEVVMDAFGGDGADLALGIGAGNMPRAPDIVWNPVSKVLKEYGVVFLAVFLVYTSYAVLGSGAPFIVAWALLVEYHLLNASTLVPIHAIYLFILCGAYVRRSDGPATGAPAAARIIRSAS